MTDEEKAEEYAKGKAHEHYHFLFEENNGSPIDFAKLCYLDGLAEGRKEVTEKYSELEKENEELKWQFKEVIEDNDYYQEENKRLEKENEELKAQIEQLSNDNHVLKTSFIAQQEQIEELKTHCKAVDEVNEKMKCCSNCANNAYCEKEHYGNDKGCEEWELAE